jgi:hypothetical protein
MPTSEREYPMAARQRSAIMIGAVSVPEQTPEARRCKFGVADSVLDRLVAQIALDGSRIDAIICQFEAAAMPQHVRMDFHVETDRFGRAFHHCLEASG